MTRKERQAVIDNLQHTPNNVSCLPKAIKAIFEEVVELRQLIEQQRDDGK